VSGVAQPPENNGTSFEPLRRWLRLISRGWRGLAQGCFSLGIKWGEILIRLEQRLAARRSRPTQLGSRRGFRTVRFGSPRARLAWGLAGVTAATVAVAVASPAFVDPQAPPASWAIWASAGPRADPGVLMQVTQITPSDCGRSRVTLSIDWSAANLRGKMPKIKNVLFAINSFVAPRQIRVRYPAAGGPIQGTERWEVPYHRAFRYYSAAGEIILAKIPPGQVQELELSFSAKIARRAGHLSCYVASPELQEYAAETTALDNMQNLGDGWLDHGHRLPGVGCCVPNDAIVDSTVNGMEPDRGALDADGIVVGRRVRVICGVGAAPAAGEKNDPWYDATTLARTSNCGAVQTFRARNASSDLNIRLFIAGALISAAAAMVIEALAAGHGGQSRPSRRSATPANGGTRLTNGVSQRGDSP
jgi:hypothetical protein